MMTPAGSVVSAVPARACPEPECGELLAIKINFLGSVTAVCLCLAAGSVQAETWDQKVDRHFSLLDTDGNGAISSGEANAHPPLARHFKRMDKNKDGGLSKYELVNYRVAPRKRALVKTVSAPKGDTGAAAKD